jgi:UPF0755 protein
MALRKAGLEPGDIDYVNAHGTSTMADTIELGAVKRVLGDDLSGASMSSTKSAIGHLLGGAGAVEAIFCILAMRDQIVPPTLNLDNPDEGHRRGGPGAACGQEAPGARRAQQLVRLWRHQRQPDHESGLSRKAKRRKPSGRRTRKRTSMIARIGKVRLVILGVLLLAAAWGAHFLWGWYGPGPLAKDTAFVVPDGASVGSIADKLEAEGAVASATTFRARARLLGDKAPIKAGEFSLPAHASGSTILKILQGEQGTLRRLVTVPEGMPAIMVQERLMAQPLLTGTVDVPEEGTVLPDSYEIRRGESRKAVLARMQAAMTKTLADLWAQRSPDTVAKTPQEAVILASIVEKETGKPAERKMVAGLYSNRLRKGMLLQADPTIIYPITRGKPLGRRIRQSEIQAVNDYNTYSMTGLPKGPSPIRAAPRSRQCCTRPRRKRSTWSPMAPAGMSLPIPWPSTMPTSPSGLPSAGRAGICKAGLGVASGYHALGVLRICRLKRLRLAPAVPISRAAGHAGERAAGPHCPAARRAFRPDGGLAPRALSARSQPRAGSRHPVPRCRLRRRPKCSGWSRVFAPPRALRQRSSRVWLTLAPEQPSPCAARRWRLSMPIWQKRSMACLGWPTRASALSHHHPEQGHPSRSAGAASCAGGPVREPDVRVCRHRSPCSATLARGRRKLATAWRMELSRTLNASSARGGSGGGHYVEGDVQPFPGIEGHGAMPQRGGNSTNCPTAGAIVP